jgi:2-oxoglutarate ferredoxin oxidoreductase subunit alpha
MMVSQISRSAPAGLRSLLLAGDSGDGVQLTARLLADTTVRAGCYAATRPRFPAEIRAPAGTLPGVSLCRVDFAPEEAANDDPVDLLIAFNSAALRLGLPSCREGATVLLDPAGMRSRDLKKAGIDGDSEVRDLLAGHRVIEIELHEEAAASVGDTDLSSRDVHRMRNFVALGLLLRALELPTSWATSWIEKKLARRPELAAANRRVVLGAHQAAGKRGDVTDVGRLDATPLPPGRYRWAEPNKTLALGVLAETAAMGLDLVVAYAPTGRAVDLASTIAIRARDDPGVRLLQAEDEGAAVGAALGASYAGGLGVILTLGSSLERSAEGIGYGVAVELPLVVIHLQKVGPSSGSILGAEQSDLHAAVFGRHGDAPVPVLAPSSVADAFEIAREAVRLAHAARTPVILLADVASAHDAQPWRLPAGDELAATALDLRAFEEVESSAEAGDGGAPGRRPLAPRVRPGVRGGELRLSGFTGRVQVRRDSDSVVGASVRRRAKMAAIRAAYPGLTAEGPPTGEVLVVSWGAVATSAAAAVRRARELGAEVAHLGLRHLWPLPADLGPLLGRFRKVLVAELNEGQLAQILRGAYADSRIVSSARSLGRPFSAAEILAQIETARTGEIP